MTSAVEGNITTVYGYDTNGNRTSTVTSVGGNVAAQTTYTYNLAHLATSMTNKNGAGTTLSSFAYTYAADGNILTETDHTNSTTYTYDLLGRLVSEVGNSGTRVYAYDVAGNRTQAIIDTATTISYNYNSDGSLASESSNNGSVSEVTTYTYDANGNLTSKSGTAGGDYAYDVWNQMTSADNASYAYNAQGLRVAKTVNGETDNFVLVGGNVWADSNTAYLRGIELISNGSQLYLYNVRGDVIQLADLNGNVTKTYDYDAYGNEYARDLGDENPFRYCGEYYDTETGFIYLRARYYDPMVGRFTSVDPIKSGLNWYSYCDNNPVTRIDPTGEAWYHWALGALVVAACAAAVVVTAGGVLAGATAVGALASGVAVGTTSTTIAAGAFLGSATIYGGCVLSAGFESNSIQEFNDKGNWGTVLTTTGGAIVGGAFGYLVDRSSRKASSNTNTISSNNDSVENNDSTDTVWDSITPADDNYPNTNIPKSFKMESNGTNLWVNKNATKHMNEYVNRNPVSHSTPINSQILLTSFKNSVDSATKSGIKYDEIVISGNWELMFGHPRNAGQLPVIYHALFR